MSVINIQELIDLISTTQATYENNLAEDPLRVSLTRPEGEANFTDVQAEYFDSKFDLLDQQHDTASGFSASVFQMDTGEKVLAIRGTDFTYDIWRDFVDADLGDIGFAGVATKQVTDMYRYWKRLTTAEGQSVDYSLSEIQSLYQLYTASKIDNFDLLTGSVLFLDFIFDLNSDTGLGIIDSSEKVYITGHSLGGNVAYAFGSLFPNNVKEIVTLNGPTIYQGMNLLLDIGFSELDQSLITSVNAEGDKVHLVQGPIIPGFKIDIAQEFGHEIADGFDNNHSSVNGVDSLNVMNLFAKIDTNLANYPTGTLKTLIQSSSNVKEDTYEILIDGLRRTLFGENIDPTIRSTKADLEKRNELYNRMDEIAKAFDEGGPLEHLKGKITIKLASGNIDNAKNNYGDFLALYFETPFAFEGANSDLSGFNIDLFNLWEADRNLTAAERAAGKANFSNEWYQDKTAFVELMLKRNQQDMEHNVSVDEDLQNLVYGNFSGNITNSIRIFTGNIAPEDITIYSNVDKILFGDFKDNIIDGRTENGVLFSADGNDRIYGLGGNDTLNGYKGNDLLDGGADDDTLTGGEGHDTLKGGEGNDTYIFDTNFGKDQIIDSDGDGKIIIGGVTLQNFNIVEGTDILYRDSIDNPKFEIIKINNGSTTDLLITSLGSGGGQILVRDWKAGEGKNLGIVLNDEVEQSPFVPVEITGNDNNNALSLYSFRTEENPNFDITAVEATHIKGEGGDDIIMGMADSWDKIEGGDGNDIISGGFTSDSSFNQWRNGLGQAEKDDISGGAGNDFIFSSVNGSVAHGNNDNDVLIGNAYALFQINPQSEYEGQSAHGELTSDQIYADLLAHMDFSFVIDEKNNDDASDDSVMLSMTYTKDFTNQFQEFIGEGSGANFIAMRTESPKTTDNGVLKHTTSGQYQFTYDFTRNNGLMPASSSNLMPVDFLITPSQLSNAADADAVASLKGVNFYGDQGRDFLWGSLFADYLSGGDDGDFIYANYGHDLLDGGNGDDYLNGEGGDDILLGGQGNDRLWGGEGNDQLFGGDGDDILLGENGDDYLVGGAGKDSFRGGEGNDIIVMDKYDGAAEGGAGNDLFIISDIAFKEAQVNANNNNSNVSPYLVGTQNGEEQYQITIRDTEGSNTTAFVGITDFSQITAQAKGDDVILKSGDTSIYLVSGMQDGIGHLVSGSSAEAIVGNQFTKQITINDFLVDAITNEVVITAQHAGVEIVGGRANDSLTANISGSQLRGGKGDDQLNGDIGDDIYIYSLNDGNDTITEKGGNNSIKFSATITPDMLDVKRINGELQIYLNNGQIIRVSNMFAESGEIVQANAIQQIQFADGTRWDQARLLEEITKPRHFVGSDYIETLIGTEGNDTLTGKKGNDQLQGGLGDDTYQFSASDGEDIIIDAQGNDRILFDETVDESAIIVRRDTKNNLIINILDLNSSLPGEEAHSIMIQNAVNADGTLNSNAIESIQFANGNLWDINRIQSEITKNLSITQMGTTTDDNLKGDNANTIFIGNQGNDMLNGGAGDDVYLYALGDGNDVIQDVNGTDKLVFTDIADPASVLVERDGNHLKLTPIDGAVITINNYFAPKAANAVDANITAVIDQLQNRWLAQAEKLIETHYGLTTTGQLHLEFVSNVDSPEAAHIELEYISGDQTASKITLEIDLTDFANAVNNPSGSGPLYFDRIIAHEMVHVLMGAQMDTTRLPPWFKEGAAELIHGADERVKTDLPMLNAGQNFVNLFHNATIENPSTSAGYSVSYIAVKLLDKEIRVNGGSGIKDIFDQLKTGKTLDQALAVVSTTYPALQSLWSDLISFENHFKAVGHPQYQSLLNLEDSDTGSIAGSDYGHIALTAETVIPDAPVGLPESMQILIPENYIESPEINGVIETIEFANGTTWDRSQVAIEIQNSSDRILNGSFTGTPDSDVITATDGNNRITGHTGDDELYGLAGNDTYIYNLGDGNDTIIDITGVDEIRFGEGINRNEVIVQRDQVNHLQIILTDGSVITVQNAFDMDGNFTDQSIESIAFSDGTGWLQSDILLQIDNYINRPFVGTVNEDVVNATEGNNTITGLPGDDQLNGGGGNDIYIYNLGDGNDTIFDASGQDEIHFGFGIHPEDIIFQKYDTSHLQIVLQDGSVVTVKNAFDESGNFTVNAIENIQYSNGIIWSQSEMLVKIQEFLNRSYGGTTGNDVIVATDGNNIITGAAGDDQLEGGAGNDVYIYNLGDGNDTIIDTSGVDEIRFGEGIYSEHIQLSKYLNNDLLISPSDGSRIIVKNVFDEQGDITSNAIEYLVFYDGTLWDLDRIKEESERVHSVRLYGTPQSDTLIAGLGKDYLEGGKGDDYLQGGESDDIYKYSHGDGNDVISDVSGVDTIEFGEGIYPNAVILRNDGNGNLNILLKHGDIITVTNAFDSRGNITDKIIESIKFIDGTLWDLNAIQSPLWQGANRDDFFIGDDNSNYLSGGNGADIINGMAGKDDILGGDGDDILISGEEESARNFYDILQGGPGSDILLVSKNSKALLDGGGGGAKYVISPGAIRTYIRNHTFTAADRGIGRPRGEYILVLPDGTDESDVIIRFVSDKNSVLGVSYVSIVLASGEIIEVAASGPMTNSGNPSVGSVSSIVIDEIHFNDGVVWDKARMQLESIRQSQNSDKIIGSKLDDVFYGSEGDDILFGLEGNDTYYFNLGDGKDVITDSSGIDSIIFGEGIGKENAQLTVKGEDLIVSFAGSDDQITIIKGAAEPYLRGFHASSPGLNNIEYFKFFNGDVWDFNPLSISHVATGDEFDNYLYGGDKDDVLTGNKGDDYLYGGKGNDTYVYALGDGRDSIFDEGGSDSILLGVGIDPDNTRVYWDESMNLILSFNSENSISISRTLNAYDLPATFNTPQLIEKITFANGVEWSWSSMLQRSYQPTDNRDTLVGTSGMLVDGGLGDDLLLSEYGASVTYIGGEGNDQIRGNVGDDVYYYSKGDGTDSVSDAGGYDIIEFGPGISFSDLSFEHLRDSLRISVGSSSDIIHISKFIDDSKYSVLPIEEFKFYDGSSKSIKSIMQILGTQPGDSGEIIGTDDDDRLVGNSGPNFLEGGKGNDVLLGGDGDDSLFDYWGENIYQGGKGNDRIGLVGTDYIEGRYISRSTEKAIVKFDLGDGVDTIDAWRDTHLRIELGAGISPENIFLEPQGYHLDIDSFKATGSYNLYIKGTSDKILSIPFSSITEIAFHDGTLWKDGEIIQTIRIQESFATLSSDGKNLYGNARPGSKVVVSYFDYDNKTKIIGDTVADDEGVYQVHFSSPLRDNNRISIKAYEQNNNFENTNIKVVQSPVASVTPSLNIDGLGLLINGVYIPGDTLEVEIYNSIFNLPQKIYLNTDPVTGEFRFLLSSPLIRGEIVKVHSSKSNDAPHLEQIAPDYSFEEIRRLSANSSPSIPTANLDSTGYVVTGRSDPDTYVQVLYKSLYAIDYGIVGFTRTDSEGNYLAELQTPILDRNFFVRAFAQTGSSQSELISVEDRLAPKPVTGEFDSYGWSISGFSEDLTEVIITNAAGDRLGSIESFGSYYFRLPSALRNGETVFIYAKDLAGNISDPLILKAPDKVAPGIPSAAFDTSTGKIITGNAEAESKIIVQNASGIQIGETRANVNGAYTLSLETALTNREIVKVTATDKAGNISIARSITAPGLSASTPAPVDSASFFIQAENYTSMKGIQKENTGDIGGGQNVGYIDAGDWMAYSNTLSVPVEGRYKVTYRVASLNGGGRLTLKESSNDNTLGSVNIPRTNGWQNWVDITQEVTLGSGEHSFKLVAETGGFNINWFKVEPVERSARILAPDIHIEQLIQAMASFAPSSGIETNVLSNFDDRMSYTIAVGQ